MPLEQRYAKGTKERSHANQSANTNDKGKGLIQRACPYGRAGEMELMGKGNSNQGKGDLQRTDRRYRWPAQIPGWRYPCVVQERASGIVIVDDVREA